MPASSASALLRRAAGRRAAFPMLGETALTQQEHNRAPTRSRVERLAAMQGFLDKQSGGKLGGSTTFGQVRAKWDKRYFVLDGSVLRYYKSEKDVPGRFGEGGGGCALH